MSESALQYSRSAFWGALVLAGILLAVIHWPALTAEIHQSELQIFQNPMVVGVGIGSSPVSPFTAQIGATGLSFYRPLTILSYRIGYFAGGNRPVVHRVINLLIVLLTAAVLLQLLWLLTGDMLVSAAAVILYMILPVVSAVPSRMAGREELLLVLFAAWAWKLHLDSVTEESRATARRTMILAGLAYLAALLSSEKAVVFLALVVLGDLTIQAVSDSQSSVHSSAQRTLRKHLPFYACLLCTTAVFFLWKYWIIGVRPWSMPGRLEALDNPLIHQSFMASLANGLKLGGIYLSKCIWQAPPMGDLYEFMPVGSPADINMLLFTAVLILVGMLAVLKFRQVPLAFMPAWIFGFGILPALNIFSTTADAVADPHMYLPALGIALGAALLGRYLLSTRYCSRLLLGGAGAALVLFLSSTDAVSSLRMFSESGWMLWLQSFEPLNVKLAAKLAQNLKGTDRMPQAVKALEDVVRARADSVQARVELSRIKANAGDLNGAARLLAEAKNLDSANPEPYLVQGNVYEVAGQDGAAIHEYESALKIQPRFSGALGLLGLIYQRSREPEKAIEYYQSALKINPGSGSNCTNLGAALAQQEKHMDALQYFERGIKLEPTLAEIYLNLGSTYMRLGRQDEAIAAYDSAAQLFSENPSVMLRTGLFFHQVRNYDRAAEIYKAALATKPQDIGLLLALGNTYGGAGDVQQALGQYKKVLELNPKSVDAYMGIGNTQSAANNNAQALEAFGKAAELMPNNPGVYFNIGNTHRSARRYPEAEAAYLKALQLQPDYAQACFNLASTYENLGKAQEAIKYYEEFIKYWKGDASIIDNAQGHILELRKQTAKR